MTERTLREIGEALIQRHDEYLRMCVERSKIAIDTGCKEIEAGIERDLRRPTDLIATRKAEIETFLSQLKLRKQPVGNTELQRLEAMVVEVVNTYSTKSRNVSEGIDTLNLFWKRAVRKAYCTYVKEDIFDGPSYYRQSLSEQNILRDERRKTAKNIITKYTGLIRDIDAESNKFLQEMKVARSALIETVNTNEKQKQKQNEVRAQLTLEEAKRKPTELPVAVKTSGLTSPVALFSTLKAEAVTATEATIYAPSTAST